MVDPRINETLQAGAVGNRTYQVGVNVVKNRTYRVGVNVVRLKTAPTGVIA